jgi:carboxylesterase type B
MFLNALILLAPFLHVGFRAPAVVNKCAGAPVVSLDYAMLEGASADGIDRFLGIPYAQPPVGDLRFRRPQPPHSFSGTTLVSGLVPSCDPPRKSYGDV